MCVYCFRFISVELKLFFLYCFALLAAELRNPLTYPLHGSLWGAIVEQPSLRYWFFPSLPFVFAITWCAAYASSRAVRWISIGLALALCVGVLRDWRIHSIRNPQFDGAIQAFERAPRGTEVYLPISPPGWHITLIKK